LHESGDNYLDLFRFSGGVVLTMSARAPKPVAQRAELRIDGISTEDGYECARTCP